MSRLSTPILRSGTSRLMQVDANIQSNVDEKKKQIFYKIFEFSLFSASSLNANAYIRILLNSWSFSPSFTLAYILGLIEWKTVQKETPLLQMSTQQSIWRTRGSFDFTSWTIFTVSSSSSTSNGMSGNLG